MVHVIADDVDAARAALQNSRGKVERLELERRGWQ
jgi:hypothetical protein